MFLEMKSGDDEDVCVPPPPPLNMNKLTKDLYLPISVSASCFYFDNFSASCLMNMSRAVCNTANCMSSAY